MLILRTSIKMKIKVLFVFLLALYGYTSHGQQVVFQKLSWQEAKAKAKEEGKDIFVDIYTTWCGPCKKMAKEVFSQKKVGDFVNHHFIALSLDAEKESQHGFFKSFKANAYPTYYWLDADGNLYDTQSGYYPADEFIKLSKQAIQSKLPGQYADARAKWQQGDRSVEFVEHFLYDVMSKVYPDSVRPYLNHFLGSLSSEQLASAKIGRLLQDFTYTIRRDSVWQTLVTYNDVYQKQLGNSFGKKMYMNLVRVPLVTSRENAGEYDKQRAILSETEFPNKKMYHDIFAMEQTLRQKNYSSALKKALEIGQANENHFPNLYSEIIYSFILADFFAGNYTPNATEMADMQRLADRAFELDPSQCTLLYKAASMARADKFRQAYELLASLPFYGEPTLSSAVYAKLNLKRIRTNNK